MCYCGFVNVLQIGHRNVLVSFLRVFVTNRHCFLPVAEEMVFDTSLQTDRHYNVFSVICKDIYVQTECWMRNASL